MQIEQLETTRQRPARVDEPIGGVMLIGANSCSDSVVQFKCEYRCAIEDARQFLNLELNRI